MILKPRNRGRSTIDYIGNIINTIQNIENNRYFWSNSKILILSSFNNKINLLNILLHNSEHYAWKIRVERLSVIFCVLVTRLIAFAITDNARDSSEAYAVYAVKYRTTTRCRFNPTIYARAPNWSNDFNFIIYSSSFLPHCFNNMLFESIIFFA